MFVVQQIYTFYTFFSNSNKPFIQINQKVFYIHIYEVFINFYKKYNGKQILFNKKIYYILKRQIILKNS